MGDPLMQSTAGSEALECARDRPEAADRRNRCRCCPPSAHGKRAAVIFPPSQQQITQQNLKPQRDDIKRGSYTMLPDESAVYYPEELSMLGEVLDQAVQSLPPDLRTPYNRVALAQNVLACASTGERDPDKLRRAALTSKLSVAA
jgi:hypothetical protein